MTFDWDTIFATAHLCSDPGMASVCISNTKPAHESAINVFMEDKVKILAAAKKYGYKQLNETGRSVSFVHATRRGERFR